ncbi:MAG: cyclic pyranopterin monophosphate synthase MoaC [Elusimicrobia bacterium]|nr:cyclic pyranopterin monophosphate synthase MoaC [Elusimicrobiota bacterium]MBP9698463.1 cyclic pyranopterin monophosphate synthase MoaC [Elusimicrobiota bacterium]
MTARFSHVNQRGEAHMVDVGAKPVTRRVALAVGEITLNAEALGLLRANKLAKGDALAVARIAGIQAAKRVEALIPLCHSVSLDSVDVDFDLLADRVRIRSVARCSGKTGVEMEALTAVSVAALTLYDMAKSIDKSMVLGPFYLESKTGGRSGTYKRRSRER